MKRLARKDISVADIRSLVDAGYKMSVYKAGNGAVVEVSFTQQHGPQRWQIRGSSYMSDQWTPTALAEIAEVAREAGVKEEGD